MKIRFMFYSIMDINLIHKTDKVKTQDPFGNDETEVEIHEGLSRQYSEQILNDVLPLIQGYSQMEYLGELARLAREVYEVVIKKHAQYG